MDIKATEAKIRELRDLGDEYHNQASELEQEVIDYQHRIALEGSSEILRAFRWNIEERSPITPPNGGILKWHNVLIATCDEFGSFEEINGRFEDASNKLHSHFGFGHHDSVHLEGARLQVDDGQIRLYFEDTTSMVSFVEKISLRVDFSRALESTKHIIQEAQKHSVLLYQGMGAMEHRDLERK